MSRRWPTSLLFLTFFFTIIVMLYTMLESMNVNIDERQKSSPQQINERLDVLEDMIQNLSKAVKHDNQKRKEHLFLPSQSPPTPEHNHPTRSLKPMSLNSQCIWRTSSPMNTTFQIRQLYDTLPFDEHNSGTGDYSFDIQYNTSQWTSDKKLKIILMPHSHCDPGWLNTYEVYFSRSTKVILDTVLNILTSNRKYKFVWAEMSFLSLWWDGATTNQRQLFKTLITNKQFEIVTGGWVMNDEANTHYFAMLDQLIEGHQFIETQLGNVSVQSGWANDPFGYSPTMAYLLKRSGIKYMAIQRVHYHIKRALAKDKRLEFYWQQAWGREILSADNLCIVLIDRNVSTRIFTHILPFYAYDIPHTCGPDPKICCQFDFKRGTDAYTTCSWGIDPVLIDDDNIQERAHLLLDQYRKKAQLYRTRVLFVQLGDDFRYRTMYEAKRQFDNYDKLLFYMNQRVDWHVDIQYGTLSDYFEQAVQENSEENFPSYMGDFFTYADHADHYWSGYFTSRAFVKRMDRVVQSYLRASEILFSHAHVNALQQNLQHRFPSNSLFATLRTARKKLGLFQHHDGITGTARDHVVDDYERKLLSVILISQTVMQQSLSYFLFPNHSSVDPLHLISNEEFQSLPTRRLLSLRYDQQLFRVVYVYNPTDQKRIEIIRILVDRYQVHVTSNRISVDSCQINPTWSDPRLNLINPNQFELLILVNIEAYSIKEYTIHASTNHQSCPLAKIEYIHQKQISKTSSEPFRSQILDTKVIEINNRFLSVFFAKTGSILSIKHKNLDDKLRFHTNLISYGSSKRLDQHSGAYIFLPDGDARDIPLSNDDSLRIQRGPLVTQIDIFHEMYALQYELTNTNGSSDYTLDLHAMTHLTMNVDTELALRFSTGIKNGAEFFTDLNGFQVMRRKTYEKLPLQGNVYPMPTMAYIEDDEMRFTILAGQPSGVACLKSGVVDVFLDRRLTHDDGRGLGQGIMDNRPIRSTFKLLFEPRHQLVDRTSLTGYPTLLAHHLSIELLYPIHVFHSRISRISVNKLSLFLKPSLFPRDYHLVNLRTLNTDQTDLALILRRFAYDCDEDYDQSFHFEPPLFEYFFRAEQIKAIEHTSLSLRTVQKQLNLTSKVNIPFAELMTYKIRFN